MLKEYFVNLPLHNSDVTVDIATGETIYHQAEKLPWKVTVVDTGQETMTGGRLKRVREYIRPDETFMLTYGDGVGNVDITALRAFHSQHGHLASMTVVSPPGRFGAVQLEGDNVTKFMEKPESGNGTINGGFFVLNTKVLDMIEGDQTIWEKEPLEQLAGMGELNAFRHDGFWHPVDTIRDKRVLESLWKGGAPWKVWA